MTYTLRIKFLLALVYICSAFPVDDSEEVIVQPEISFTGGEIIDFDDHDSPDVESLRKLDELIGKVELAAMSRVSLDVDDELPEIEQELIREEAIELFDEHGELADVSKDLKKVAKKEFSIIALPHKFRRYDANKDGFVTLEELADATETSIENSREPFQIADTDGDGLLTKEELQAAPWEFDLQREQASED